MSAWLTALPVVGALLGRVLERVFPDKSLDKQIELKELEKFKYSPKVLMKYTGWAVFTLFAGWLFLHGAFHPAIPWLPEPPMDVYSVLKIVDSLFGLD